MIKAKALKKGDKVAIVSLSSGLLGEKFIEHQKILGKKRLKEFGLETVFMPNSLKGLQHLKNNPQERAQDLKQAFLDDSISAIVCAIGGDDTFKTLPYLLEDQEFILAVKNNPKIFSGYSDSTVNHLMFYKLGLQTFYGPNFIVDLAELDNEMLPYTKQSFRYFFENKNNHQISPSAVWYEERKDFSKQSLNTSRVMHKENKGYEILQGKGKVTGRLLGGCLDSLYDIITGDRYEEQKEVCEKYNIFPSTKEWKNKILFIETSESKPTPNKYKLYLQTLKNKGVLDEVSAIMVGKPQDEAFYEEYKTILKELIPTKPIIFNVNFGHSHPKTILPYGALTEIDFDNKKITLLENSLI